MDKKQKKQQQIALIIKESKRFQYTGTVALNYEETGKNSERITKIKPFIDKYNWEGIIYVSGQKDWKKIEKNSLQLFLMCYTLKKNWYMPCVPFKT